MLLPVAVVPRVRDRLRDVLAEVVVLEGRDRRDLREIAVEDRAAREIELRALRIERQVRHRQVIRDTLAVTEPVGIHRADRADVDEVDLLYELVHRVQQALHLIELGHVQCGVVVQIDRVGDAADREVLDVRGLAAEDGHNLVHLALVVQRLQVMRHRQQVHFRRELHRRVPPVTVREDAQLSSRDELREAVLHLRELLRAVTRPVRDAGRKRSRLHRVGLQRRGDIDPVEGGQLVEVHDVVVHGVRRDDEIADVLRVLRNLELQRVLHGPHRGNGVDGRADTAEPLGEHPRFAGISSFEDAFDATEHLTR